MTYKVTVRYTDGAEKVIAVESEQTILDAAESSGVPIVNVCRSGICGTCVGLCIEGNYELGRAEGLGQLEKEERKILTCQTRVNSDCTVELDYPMSENAAKILSGEAVLTGLNLVSDTTAILSLNASGLSAKLDYKPGQFALLCVPGTNKWRSYSYAHVPEKSNQLEFIVRLLPRGIMSDYLRSRAKVGDKIQLRGSKGSFYLRQTTRPIILMAGGSGLSAILAIMEQLVVEKVSQPIRLYYGVSHHDDLCKLERLTNCHKQLADFEFNIIVGRSSPEWTGPTGLITDLLDKEKMNNGNVDIYLCGPAPMVEATRQWLSQHDLNNAILYYEKFVANGDSVPGQLVRIDPAKLDYEAIKQQGRGTAVVIGGSFVGMPTAKVLTEKFDKVIVLEKDSGHNPGEARPGATQGWHLHHLLMGGRNVLESIFPGITEDMVREGAFKVDTAHQYRILIAGSWKKVFKSGLEIIAASRPLLEWCLRRRLDTENNIDYRYESKVEDLIYDPVSNRILGVAVVKGNELELIPAEFVVDASGKNTEIPILLERYGIGFPEIDEDSLNAFYSTMRHKVPPELRWKDKVMVICYAYRPHQEHYAAVYFTDSSRTILATSLIAYNCDRPPRNHEEFKEFAKLMPSPVFGEIISRLEPCSPVYNFRYPSMIRYKYEEMSNLPHGLVAIGDAYCSADPVSGAGITKGLLELNELRALLKIFDADSNDLVTNYYRKVSKIADKVWFVIREQNLRYPWVKDVKKKRPFYFGVLVWYMDRILELIHDDVDVYRQWLAVTHFVSPPASLMSPAIAFKAILKWLGTKVLLRKTLIERNFSDGKMGDDEPMP